ncbi:MAG: DUF1700 domain-containing protein [Candidatus Sulfotelmatobacter sp.]
MSIAEDSRQKIEAYLGRLRSQLRGMNSAEVNEIVEELRSHITEKTEAGGPGAVEGVLVELGGPEELAAQYLTDDLLVRAEVTRSPVRVLESLFRWASLSAVGFFVLLSSIVGYFLGGAFMWCAVLKIVHPQSAGLWVIPGVTGNSEISLRLGCASWQQRRAGLVDYTAGIGRWLRDCRVDHALRALVCGSIPEVACLVSRLT